MGRRRGGVKRQIRRAIAIALGKNRKITGHNVPQKSKLYRELESISDAAFVNSIKTNKPTIVADRRISVSIRKLVFIVDSTRELVLEAPLRPVDYQAADIPVITLE